MLMHRHSRFYGLQKALLIDACNKEAGLVKGLGAFSRGTDTDGREGMPHTGEETALLGQRTRVGDHGKGIHLQTVVVVETEGFVLDDTTVELEARLLQAFTTARMTALEDWHIIFLCHLVDGVEKRQEILLGVDVLLAVGAQKNVLALLQA